MGVPVYKDVSYNGIEYSAGSILYKENLVEFLIDRVDLSAVSQYAWHFVGNGLATTVVGERKRELYMHALIMGPGPTQIVQHISGNGLDNRRANLRLINKADAALNRVKSRTIELPALCGIKPEDIPTHVWYVQANGYHRDRFAIEFKTEGILWKSTSSKSVSLQEKLEAARAKLAELYLEYPHLDPAVNGAAAAALKESFEAIILSSHGFSF
jgi:hypothetical protein